MNEADKKFTPGDKARLQRFLNKNESLSSNTADVFVRNLPIPNVFENYMSPTDEDIKLLRSRNLLLSWFFEDHFRTTPPENTEEAIRDFHANFYLWQETTEEDFLIANTPAALECADIVKDLCIADTYAYAKTKRLKLNTETSKHFLGTSDFKFLIESCKRWGTYESIARGAFIYEKKPS